MIYQKSLTAIEFGSTAKVDRHGRINNSIIETLNKIKVRLPGQAGLADVANLHHNFYIYITRHDKKRLVEQVDFSSGGRYFQSIEERTQAQLPLGLSKVFTNLGVFELHPTKRTLVLTHIHPGVSLEDVRENTGFPLDVSDGLQETKAPTKEQLHLIRHVIDPLGFRKLEFIQLIEIRSYATCWIKSSSFCLNKSCYPFRENKEAYPCMRLHNKVAVITGAADGIGKEVAFMMAREGAKVVIADMIKAEKRRASQSGKGIS